MTFDPAVSKYFHSVLVAELYENKKPLNELLDYAGICRLTWAFYGAGMADLSCQQFLKAMQFVGVEIKSSYVRMGI